MTNDPSLQMVHVEFQRVQTWLFSVPRLRGMLGANVMLGEVLREELGNLARRENGAWKLAPISGDFPGAIEDDPLRDYDDPSLDAKAGILSRDGGHFEAQFEYGAAEFANAAGELIRQKLAELRFRISVDGVAVTFRRGFLSNELPVLAPCQWTGRGLSSYRVYQGNDPSDVSLSVKLRHEASKSAEKWKALDLATQLSSRTKLRGLVRPEDLEDLVGDGYLALIHADGNGVGSGGGAPGAEQATFFHQTRVVLRQAVQAAIDEHCPASGVAPLVPLMLGGDDLLVICRAEKALPFVTSVCANLDALQKDSKGFKLALGVGVVIAKRVIPVYRLHEVVEQLASSAKRRVRGLSDKKAAARSVVDWAVYSAAWVDDPSEVRQRDWIRGAGNERRVLSRRPLDVLGSGLDSLQGLVKRVGELKDAPRSQLRFLLDQLPRGRVLSELAFAELSADARRCLIAAGIEHAWTRQAEDSVWQTSLLDLIEVFEIDKLGRQPKQAPKEPEVAHG